MGAGLPKGYERSSPASRFHGRIAEIHDAWGVCKDFAHHFALDADAAAVDDPERLQTEFVRFQEVFLDYSFLVRWSNTV